MSELSGSPRPPSPLVILINRFPKKQVQQDSWAGQGDSDSYANQHPAKCSQSDKRWVAMDTISEEALLLDPFTRRSECTACTYCDDYLSTAAVCAASVTSISPASTDCATTEGSTFGNCLSSDTICQDIMYQSKCGCVLFFVVYPLEMVVGLLLD